MLCGHLCSKNCGEKCFCQECALREDENEASPRSISTSDATKRIIKRGLPVPAMSSPGNRYTSRQIVYTPPPSSLTDLEAETETETEIGTDFDGVEEDLILF